MASFVILSAPNDTRFAQWLDHELSNAGYEPVLWTPDGSKLEDVERTLFNTAVVLLLVSPDCAASDDLAVAVTLARQHNRPLIPLLIRHTPGLPWYIDSADIEDFSDELDRPLARLLQRLPPPPDKLTFGKARDAYLQRATLKSVHTLAAYERSLDLFLTFIGDRSVSGTLPIQTAPYLLASEIPLSALDTNDAPLFLHFAQWLLSPSSGRQDDKRPYKPTTIELRVAGVINWFQFMDDHGWLPARFQLARAKRIVRDELRGRPSRSGAPQPPDFMEEVIYFYDNQERPPRLRKADADSEQIRRWELTRLRNRALVHALAETGGRISEVLSLNLADFPARYLARNEVLRVEVRGKGGHTYNLRFYDSLPAIRAYIEARGAHLRASARGEVPLFVSHDPHYEDRRMSRIVAWRVVQRAARALGLRDVSPHDFRHWRATQLINAGHPLDVVQDYLGHRSVETTRAYYAHTDPLRVDDAARSTRLPDLDDDGNAR